MLFALSANIPQNRHKPASHGRQASPAEPRKMTEFQIDHSILASSEIFRDLPEEAIEEARRLAFRKRLEKREVLYHQGDDSERVYIVVVGRLRAAQTSAEGTQVALRYLGPGEMTGYAAIAGIADYPS